MAAATSSSSSSTSSSSTTPVVLLALALLGVVLLYGLQVEPMEDTYADAAGACDGTETGWRRVQCAARAAFGVRKDA